MVGVKVRKFKPGEFENKKISSKLVREVMKVRSELQREENIRRGRKAKIISFILASDILAKRFRQ